VSSPFGSLLSGNSKEFNPDPRDAPKGLYYRMQNCRFNLAVDQDLTLAENIFGYDGAGEELQSFVKGDYVQCYVGCSFALQPL
jgi:hypothetical protein